MTNIHVPISPGELLDKITILNIKRERIQDATKQRNVAIELAQLEQVSSREIGRSDEIDELIAQLQAVNGKLWDIEDDIRDCERQSDFGEKFISLARSVYIQNDQRAAVKHAINTLLGSELIEEKSYAAY